MRNNVLIFLSVFFLASFGCALPTGMLRSRWAMDDNAYAEKYAQGAEKSDIAGKLKPSIRCSIRFRRRGNVRIGWREFSTRCRKRISRT